MGDGGDGCATLACDGGVKINCNKWEDDKWKHRKVTCSGTLFSSKRYLFDSYNDNGKFDLFPLF